MDWKMRKHQAEVQKYAERLTLPRADGRQERILVHVVPGGGKSRLPGILAKNFPNHKIGWFVPRISLQGQGRDGLIDTFGIELRDAGNDINPSRNYRGFITTHAALMVNPDLWIDELRRYPYILVIDEIHHAKLNTKRVPNQLASVIDRLPCHLRCDMTGTLDTNDNSFIYGIRYDKAGGTFTANGNESADKFVRYSRQDALDDGAIVPISFYHHDGPVKFMRDGEVTRTVLSEVSKRDLGGAIFTALRTDIAEQLMENGYRSWKQQGRGKLIIVVYRQEEAKKWGHWLRKRGEPSFALAITDNDQAKEAILNFRNIRVEGKPYSPTDIMITCQMAYEGLDAPEASHVIALTHIRSVPWIEQMLGRIWRKSDGKDRCFAFVPDDPEMKRIIEKIRLESPGMVIETGEGPPSPPPPPRQPLIPISSNVDEVRKTDLDPKWAIESYRKKLEEICGVKSDRVQDQIEALARELAREDEDGIGARRVTGKQKEIMRRNEIAALARAKDRYRSEAKGHREIEWGFTQKELYRRTGKSITEMTLEEMDHAERILESL